MGTQGLELLLSFVSTDALMATGPKLGICGKQPT